MEDMKQYLGDRHNGKCVQKVYIKGEEWIYKPRSLKIDRICEKLCAWFTEKSIPITIHVPHVIDNGKDGYASCIQHKEIETVSNTSAFFDRAGAIIAFCYIMGSHDIHVENVIAHDEYPIIVDMETLINGEVRLFTKSVGEKSTLTTQSYLHNSVLYSSLLPHCIRNSDGLGYDIGGVSGYIRNGLVESKNKPLLYGKQVNAEYYVENICNGFIKTYSWIVEHREELLNESPYKEFANCQIRFLIRSTQVYANLLNRLSQPDMIENTKDFEAQLSKLALAYTKYAHPSRLIKLMPIYEAEAAAIRRGDIPYFTTHADSLALCDENGNVLCDDYFELSAFTRSNNIIMNMNMRDCEFQTELIRASFQAVYPSVEVPNVLICLTSTSLSGEGYLAEVNNVYNEIEKRKCEMDDGAPAWPMQCAATEGACGVKMTEVGLYSGRAGVAVFDAALYNVTGNESARKDAERIVAAIFAELEDRDSTHLLEKLTLGLANGIGGVFFAISEISRYLDRPDYISRITAWLDKLTNTWLARDKDYDVIGGAAGLLLGMFRIGAKKETIVRVADHILDNRIEYNGHKLIFRPQMDTLPLTGMGHGAAGIACALLMAWRMTNDDKYRAAALDMLAYERECFSVEESNWPDYRKNLDVPIDETVYMHGWCAGAPGIGFSRKRIQTLDPEIDVSADINAAKTWAHNHMGVWRDHLCCGNATLVDWLTECGDLNAARDIAARMITRKKRDGKYCLSTFQGQFVADVGLFSGLSGIGYAFLRAACPEKIRSILM